MHARHAIDARRLDLAAIRKRPLAIGNRHGDVEGHLEARLVETGEGLARGDRFELREDVVILAHVHAVEALECLVEGGVVGDAKVHLAGLHHARKHDARDAFFGIDELPSDGDGLAALARCGGLRDGEVLTMNPHAIHGLGERDVDLRRAREALLCRVDL